LKLEIWTEIYSAIVLSLQLQGLTWVALERSRLDIGEQFRHWLTIILASCIKINTSEKSEGSARDLPGFLGLFRSLS